MKRIINHVNSKPEHIRHLVALGCTAVVGAVVFSFWLNSFQHTSYALLNPDQTETAAPTLAQSNDSLFGRIGSVFADVKAQIGNLFSGSNTIENQNVIEQPQDDTVHPLPLSN